MAMDEKSCVQAIVDYYDVTVGPFREGLATPRKPSKPWPVAFLKDDGLQKEALFLLAGEDSWERDIPGVVKLTISKESFGPGKGWFVQILFS